jgi:tRNA modification GTPase
VTADGPTRVVLLTPPGRGAVASVLVAGPAATALVATAFQTRSGRALAQAPLDRIVLGHWLSAGAGEEVVVCRRAVDRVEIHCHGGHAAWRAIVDTLVAAGCQATDWRAWLRATEPDPLAAAAQIALAEAATQRAAGVLLDQWQGALRRAIAEIERLLINSEFSAAATLLDALLARASLGLHLVEPWRVVLAGPPNVGKSSLINALLGYRRAIVHDQPGTTRDVVSETTALDGWPVVLSDTAGLHQASEPLEAAGIEQARQQLAKADLVVWVVDGSLPADVRTTQPATTMAAAITVVNKCDLAASADWRQTGALLTSATTGAGLDELARAIVAQLVPCPPEPGEAVPFTVEQVAALTAAGAAVGGGDAAEAQRHLSSLALRREGDAIA